MQSELPATVSALDGYEDLAATIRRAWAAALGHEDFRDDDDFFAVGGHSLLVARIMAPLGKSLGTRLSLRLFFDNPTVEQLASALSEHARQNQGVHTNGR